MKKKIMSYIVVFAMVVTTLSVTAFAEDENNSRAVRSTPHTHCICGATHTAIGNHTDADKYTGAWTPISDLSEVTPGTTDNPNYYYLTNNITWSGSGIEPGDSEYFETANPYAWTPADNVVLCLNGYSISSERDAIVISISDSNTFTLTDCQSTSGKITHANTAGADAGISNGGTFNMYGGNITQNGNTDISGSFGGGVLNYGVFNLYGGSITNNTTGWNGSAGGVFNGISNDENAPATFNMYGGIIKGNQGAAAGGVYNIGSSMQYPNNKSIFNMYGGSIIGNKATSDESLSAGGVMNKGILVLEGEVTISDNLGRDNWSEEDNMYIPDSGCNSNLCNDNETQPIRITENGLWGKAHIRLSPYSHSIDSIGLGGSCAVTGDNGNVDYSSYFSCDQRTDLTELMFEIFNDATDSNHQVVKARLVYASDTPVTPATAAKLTISVGTDGTITGDTATNGGTLSYYLVSADKQAKIGAWTVDTADTQVVTDLGVSAEASKPTLTTSENGKYLVVVEAKNGKVVAAGQSAAIAIKAPAPSSLAVSVDTDGTINVAGSAVGTFKYAVVSADPTANISAWTTDTTESHINSELSATLSSTVPTLDYTRNGSYLLVVDIDSGKAVAVGVVQIISIASGFSVSNISAESVGGAGKVRTITCAGAFTGSEKLVVQITAADGSNTVVMIDAANSAQVSYAESSTVTVWITSGMPTLTAGQSAGVTIYHKFTSTN